MDFSSLETAGIIAIVATVLLSISEALPLTDKVKANSVFQLVVNILKGLAGK